MYNIKQDTAKYNFIEHDSFVLLYSKSIYPTKSSFILHEPVNNLKRLLKNWKNREKQLAI